MYDFGGGSLSYFIKFILLKHFIEIIDFLNFNFNFLGLKVEFTLITVTHTHIS